MTLSRAQDTETEALAYQLQRIDLRLGREIGRFCVRHYTHEQLAGDADMLLGPADLDNLAWQKAQGRFWLQLDDIATATTKRRFGFAGMAARPARFLWTGSGARPFISPMASVIYTMPMK